VALDKPADLNLILRQSHFIKTVEDLHETLVGAVPGMKFGLAFCESSRPRLVRKPGTAPVLTELAAQNAQAIGAGRTFLIFLGNVLNAVKTVPEVCRIFYPTANPI
jgi:adenosine/AMP kinase